MNTASKIVKLLKLEYLENVDEALILNPKIIGNSTDLEEIYRKTIDASREMETLIKHIIWDVNLIKSSMTFDDFYREPKFGTFLYNMKRIAPDSYRMAKSKMTEKQIRKYLISLYLDDKKLYFFDLRESEKSVLEILTEIINFKKELGLSPASITFDELKDRVTLNDDELKEELNGLVSSGKVTYEKGCKYAPFNNHVLFYLP